MVNEPSVFEPLKFYCTYSVLIYSISFHRFQGSSGTTCDFISIPFHLAIWSIPLLSGPVFNSLCCAGKVLPCPLFNIVFPSFSSVHLFFFCLSFWGFFFGNSPLISRKTFRYGQITLSFRLLTIFVILTNGCLDLRMSSLATCSFRVLGEFTNYL